MRRRLRKWRRCDIHGGSSGEGGGGGLRRRRSLAGMGRGSVQRRRRSRGRQRRRRRRGEHDRRRASLSQSLHQLLGFHQRVLGRDGLREDVLLSDGSLVLQQRVSTAALPIALQQRGSPRIERCVQCGKGRRDGRTRHCNSRLRDARLLPSIPGDHRRTGVIGDRRWTMPRHHALIVREEVRAAADAVDRGVPQGGRGGAVRVVLRAPLLVQRRQQRSDAAEERLQPLVQGADGERRGRNACGR